MPPAPIPPAIPMRWHGALQKIEDYSKRVPLQATPSTAHLFIIAPLIGGGFGSLFSTHPPTKERIRRLIGRDLV